MKWYYYSLAMIFVANLIGCVVLAAPGQNNIPNFAPQYLVIVPPLIPDEAFQKRIEGFVIIQFTVTPSCAVTDIVVVESQPKGLFDKAAIEAVKRWCVEPLNVGGEYRYYRATQRIDFELPDRAATTPTDP